jgi:hypothetical protein
VLAVAEVLDIRDHRKAFTTSRPADAQPRITQIASMGRGPGGTYVQLVTITDDERAAGRAADALQAAYFRAELEAERWNLLNSIVKRRALIDRPGDAGGRQRTAFPSAEAELRHLDRLIATIDRRFGAPRPLPVRRAG